MATALYERDGATYVPTELTTGPWYDDAQHGGPPAALLAGLVDGVDSDIDVRVARLTIELLRPVPMAPLEAVTRMVRPGKRVQIVEAELVADGAAVARAIGLRIRVDHVDLPALAPAPPPPPPGSGRPPARVPAGGYVTEAVEIRFIAGDFREPGPGIAWVRLRQPVVAGEDPTPLQRVAAAADFGNGISAELHVRHHWYVNPDLTIYLHRLPRGEWIGMDARTHLDTDGIGIADNALHDEDGRIGRSVQALFVANRR